MLLGLLKWLEMMLILIAPLAVSGCNGGGEGGDPPPGGTENLPEDEDKDEDGDEDDDNPADDIEPKDIDPGPITDVGTFQEISGQFKGAFLRADPRSVGSPWDNSILNYVVLTDVASTAEVVLYRGAIEDGISLRYDNGIWLVDTPFFVSAGADLNIYTNDLNATTAQAFGKPSTQMFQVVTTAGKFDILKGSFADGVITDLAVYVRIGPGSEFLGNCTIKLMVSDECYTLAQGLNCSFSQFMPFVFRNVNGGKLMTGCPVGGTIYKSIDSLPGGRSRYGADVNLIFETDSGDITLSVESDCFLFLLDDDYLTDLTENGGWVIA